MCCLISNTFCLINTHLCKWATDNVHVPNTNSVTVCQNWKHECIQYVCTLLIHFLSVTAIVYNVYASMMFVVIHSGGKLMASGQLRKLPTLCGIVMNHQVTTFRAVFICGQITHFIFCWSIHIQSCSYRYLWPTSVLHILLALLLTCSFVY